jgi:hypothetical protein
MIFFRSLAGAALISLAAFVQPLAEQQASSPLTGFAALANEFVFRTLSFSPSGATQTGLHRYTDPQTKKVLALDEMLDDYSPAGMAAQRAYYEDFRRRLAKLKVGSLDPQTRADYDIMQYAIGFAFFSMDGEQFYKWKPQMYSENLGSALFANISLEYADKDTRAKDLSARVEKIPVFVDQAIANLTASNDIFRRVGIESIDGVRDLLRTTGADFVKGTPSEARYAAAEPAALAALDKFTAFVRDDLPKKPQRDHRQESLVRADRE